jgi:ribosome-associated toxin RatA of RatAB toxin-antitoxin module
MKRSEVAVEVDIDGTGQPLAARAHTRIDRPVADVWKIVSDVAAYPGRLPMMHRVRLDRDRATVDLKFKIALFSVGFQFIVDVDRKHHESVQLKYVSGEPRNILLGFHLEPLDDGAACRLRSTSQFDAMSLGWLAKYFLKHHPEIQHGIVPGVAIGLLESMRQALKEA